MLPVVAMHEIGGSDLTVRQSEVVLDRAPQPEQLIKANRCGHIILTQDAMADPFGAGNKTTEHRAAGMKRAVIVDLGDEEEFGGITARLLELGQAEDPALARSLLARSAARHVGEEWVRTCRSRGATYH